MTFLGLLGNLAISISGAPIFERMTFRVWVKFIKFPHTDDLNFLLQLIEEHSIDGEALLVSDMNMLVSACKQTRERLNAGESDTSCNTNLRSNMHVVSITDHTFICNHKQASGAAAAAGR